jgi:hypothetical protein
MENIPPTLHLEKHVKRAVYQAGHFWGQSLIGDPEVPSPDLWGWERVRDDSPWTPWWTTLPEAAKACLVQKDASVSKQILSVQSCASVQDSVTLTENKQANLNICDTDRDHFNHVLT